MAATRRIKKELLEIRELGLQNFRKLKVDENNVLLWQALIVPDDPPYNKGAFKIEINFPFDYPFRPPKLHFHTKIYHPNIDEQGYVCLPIIMAEFWKPATRMSQVIMAVIALVSNPDPHYALRADAAEELLKDRRKFMITAERYTEEHALQRPKPLEPPKEQSGATPGPGTSKEKSGSVSAPSNEKSGSVSATPKEKSVSVSAPSNEKSGSVSATPKEKSASVSAPSNEKSGSVSATPKENSGSVSTPSNEKSGSAQNPPDDSGK